MGGMTGARRRDDWGKRPTDPFLKKLMKDPRRAARLSMLFTIGMILFWLFFVTGMMFIAAYLLLG
ncbi:MAG: hypothetical protein JXA22_09865 [Candidatus Thermoplasmatota archaeon]|nr:hypothetical protein [Candidatus Thermoplasmatota archaeon]